jgi:capsular exopolysaccharide synthesis family protein
MQAVIDRLHLSTTPADLATKVVATVPLDTVVLQVTVSDSTAAGAQRIAQAIAAVLPSYLERLERADAKTNPVTVTTVLAPTLPSAPASPKKALDLALGLVVGLACGAAWVLWRASRDETIRTADDVESAVGAPVLSEIPGGSDLRPAAPGAPLGAGWDSPRSEAYRRLRTSLQFKADGDRAGVVVVASASPGEGRTTTAANLATAMAIAGKRVILIDGDLREPRLSEQFGYDGETGLTDVLRGRSRLESEVRLWQADLNLGILPAGGTVDNPSELLSSQALVSVLDTCRRSADVVLIDTPPLLNVTDGSIVAGLSDGALLVVRHGETLAQSAAAAAAQLREADTDLHGVIINHVPGPLASRLRYRERRDIDIPEIPAILTPAVEGTSSAAAKPADVTAPPAQSTGSNETSPGPAANGTGPHVSASVDPTMHATSPNGTTGGVTAPSAPQGAASPVATSNAVASHASGSLDSNGFTGSHGSSGSNGSNGLHGSNGSSGSAGLHGSNESSGSAGLHASNGLRGSNGSGGLDRSAPSTSVPAVSTPSVSTSAVRRF